MLPPLQWCSSQPQRWRQRPTQASVGDFARTRLQAGLASLITLRQDVGAGELPALTAGVPSTGAAPLACLRARPCALASSSASTSTTTALRVDMAGGRASFRTRGVGAGWAESVVLRAGVCSCELFETPKCRAGKCRTELPCGTWLLPIPALHACASAAVLPSVALACLALPGCWSTMLLSGYPVPEHSHITHVVQHAALVVTAALAGTEAKQSIKMAMGRLRWG